MKILLEIVLFGLGVGFSLWWFSVTVLPIFYGLPRSVFWIVKGKLKVRASFAYIKTFLLWTILFTFAAYLLLEFLPQTVTYLHNSRGFSLGQLFGVIGALISTLSKSGRQSLNEDFWAAMAKYLK